jgi:DUF4097 and DUF4098 domain-containing protein YvlB
MRKLSLALMFVISAAAFGDALVETFDRTVDVRPGSRVEIDNVNGKVRVSAWDQPQVRIHAVKKVHDSDDREIMRQLRIDVRQEGSTLEIETAHPRRKDDVGFLDFLFGNHVNTSVDYEVTVPRTIDLSVETVNGSIVASDVSGEIEVETTNGKIDVARCSGTVDAETTNGSISVELMQVRAGRGMRFETTNGRINLTLPPNIAANIDASTTNGKIATEIPITTQRFSRRSLRGTLNGGGTDIVLRTTNGGIEIRSALAQ